jgi:hypothetical protein
MDGRARDLLSQPAQDLSGACGLGSKRDDTGYVIGRDQPAASTASSAKSLDFWGSILMPGLMVDDSVTDFT